MADSPDPTPPVPHFDEPSPTSPLAVLDESPPQVELTVERRKTRPQIDVAALRALNGAPGWARQMADATGRPLKICITGFTEHRALAPFSDPDFQIWGCNKLWQIDDRPFDRIYDPHALGDIRRGDPVQAEWLAKGGTPAYVIAEQPDWPSSITLPADDIMEHFAVSASGSRYFTNTIAWMVAHALYEGPPDELWIVGVDMAAGSEWGGQRPSCEYWIGKAEAIMGKPVMLPMESDLLKTAVAYGIEEDAPYYYKMKARVAELQQRLEQAQGQLGGLDSSYNAQRLQLVNLIGQCQGAIEQCNYQLNCWHPPRTQAGEAIHLRAMSDGKAGSLA